MGTLIMFKFVFALLLSFEVCLSLKLSNVKSTQSKEVSDCSGYSITDTITASVTTSGHERELDVALFIRHPMEEGQWIRAGVNEQSVRFSSCSPGTCYISWFNRRCSPAHCHYIVVLRKELIGYDLIKPADSCDPEDVTKLPFSVGKYGEPVYSDAGGMEYLLVVGNGTQSVSQITAAGDRWEDEWKPEFSDVSSVSAETQDTSLKEVPNYSHKNQRSNSDVEVVGFYHYPYFFGLLRKFICKVHYQHQGSSVNLGSNIVSNSVKFYYRSSSTSSWGNPFLYGQYYSYSGGINTFFGVAFSPSLAVQGISVASGCFRCEATVNGITDTYDNCSN